MTAPLSVKPIRTDEDHEAALDDLERLWDAEPGTPEHDVLEVLAIVIDDYENRRSPRSTRWTRSTQSGAPWSAGG